MNDNDHIEIAIDSDDFSNCPYCGQEVFVANIQTQDGNKIYAKVCQACELGWLVLEDPL